MIFRIPVLKSGNRTLPADIGARPACEDKPGEYFESVQSDPEGKTGFVGVDFHVSTHTLFEVESLQVQSAVATRRQEFATGRWCARRAMRILGHEPGPIPVGEGRSPLWPVGVHGSISHTHGFTCALVTDGTARVGLDVERLDREITRPTWDLILSARETRRFHTESEKLMVFSAKETFFKAVYPLVRRMVGFHEIEIEYGNRPKEFAVRLGPFLSLTVDADRVLPIACEIREPFVFTWTFIKQPR